MASQHLPSSIIEMFRGDFIKYMSDVPTFIHQAIRVKLLTGQDKDRLLSSQNNVTCQILEILDFIGGELPEKSDEFLYSLHESGNSYLAYLLLHKSGNDYLADVLLQGKYFEWRHLRTKGLPILIGGGPPPLVDATICYSMKKGRVVIIENVHFEYSTRYGSEADIKALDTFFSKLNFEVVIRQNLTAKEMEAFLHDQIYNEKGSKEDCFILFILSHGRVSEIFGVDGETMNYSVIFEKFNNCPIWNNQEKPKLIYIQACQPFLTEEETTEELDAHQKVTSNIYPGGHFYIMYATIPGKNAMRNTQTGSRLIQCLMKVYEEKYLAQDIEVMGIEVRRQVYKVPESTNMQIAVSHSGLIKLVYLGPD